MLVGQAPGPHEERGGRPFAHTAGRRLFSWFAALGISEESFRRAVHICAVVRCFPGRNPAGTGDRLPDADEIGNCARHLDRELALLRPSLVIAVGTLAASQFIEKQSLDMLAGRLHRASRGGIDFDLVVLPHPSGRSTWLNHPEHRALLERSLSMIVSHPGFSSV